MNFKFLSLLPLIIMFIVSCKKEKEINEGSLLSRIRHIKVNRTFTIDSFIYDTQDRLVGIRYLNGNSNYDKDIQYDAQGRLSKVNYSYEGVERYSSNFVYNDKGQIIKKTDTPAPGYDHTDSKAYAYDNSGRLIGDTTFYKQTNTILYYMTFRYDDKENIIETDFTNVIDPGNQGKTQHQFDNRPNPFNLQGSIYFFVTGRYIYLNKNNQIEEKPWWIDSRINEYEYQENGLPKKTTLIDPLSQWGSYRATFLYEYR